MSFLREVFSEDNQGSASRVMMAVHAIAGVGWISYAVHKTGARLSSLSDFAALAGFIAAVTAFVVAPYAINKLGSAADSFAARPKS